MIRSSFTAQLTCRHGLVGTSRWVFKKKMVRQEDRDRAGWLLTASAPQHPLSQFVPLTFHFRYLPEMQSDTRSYYVISCLNNISISGFLNAGTRVEQNYNGWLGLYNPFLSDLLFSGDSVHWKIETLQSWDGNPATAHQVPFYLRDAKGHRVSQVDTYTGSYLNAGEMHGEILQFNFVNIANA